MGDQDNSSESDAISSLGKNIIEELSDLDRLELKEIYDSLMEDKCRVSSEDLDKEQMEASRAAAEARKDALTYNSAVGASILTWDGEIFTGINMENKPQNTPHAEQNAIRSAAQPSPRGQNPGGYRFTDFRDLYVVYIDESHEESDEITQFPACPACQATAWKFTHPYLDVYVSDGDGEPLYEAYLKEILDPPAEGRVFASEELRGFEDLKNKDPELPLADELHEFYERDEEYKNFCNLLGVELEE